MKMNLPVTGREHAVPAGRSLVSRTDTKGIITFANDAFVEVSGFSREELIGRNHNIVRHPDIPPVIFQDMWDTLKQGLPWRGVVKNRCKNGDHYWVDAKVVPVRKNGETIGYMSVRTPPRREAIPLAEAAYAAAAQAGGIHGHSSNAGWKKFLSIRNGVLAGIVFVTLMMIAGGILGIGGLRLSNHALRALYQQDTAPIQAIGRINFLMADNRAQVALAMHHAPGAASASSLDHPLTQHLALLEQNRAEIDALWQGYAGKLQNAGERALAERYWAARTRYVDAGLLPAQAALESGDYAAVERLLLDQVTPLYDAANGEVSALLQFLAQRAQRNSIAVAERNELISIVAMAGIALGCGAFILFGIFFFRATVLPLDAAVQDLERISEGNLSGDSALSGHGEPGRVTAAVTVMQLHLKVMMDEISLSSASIRDQCRRLNQNMMNLAEHSEEQHDRVQQTLDNINALCSGMNQLALDTDELLLLTEQADTAEDIIAAPEDVAEAGVQTASVAAEQRLQSLVQELAGAARIEAFTLQDSVAQIRQIAVLIAENRGDVQDAWSASQQLELAAEELDKLVKYFE